MSAIGTAGRCCRGCGKDRGPGRRRRRRQQPCLSSCSSCCYPNWDSPAAWISAGRDPLCGPCSCGPSRPAVKKASFGCTRLGRLACGLRTAPARLRRRLGAGCSAIVTAAPERARKEEGYLFVQRPEAPREASSPLASRNPATGPPGGGGLGGFLFEIWEFYLPKGFNF